MASSPYARVAQLTGLPVPSYARHPYAHTSTTTPTTLTGHGNELRSYALPIACLFDADGSWLVYDHKSSPTTNRHLSAVRACLAEAGYQPTDETTGNYRTYRRS